MSVKITQFEAENVKRIKALTLTPAPTGLTVIGGRNNQGKTSGLDAIVWALGGDRYRPSQAQREGSVLPPRLRLELSNGIIVERSGKNSDLKVTDASGRRAGQQLLHSFVEQLALDMPRFMQSTGREKAATLLRIIGLEEQVAKLERQEKELYNQRHAIGQIADQKAKYAKELPSYPEAPAEPVSAYDLIRRQQDILARNGENQRKRERAAQLAAEMDRVGKELALLEERYKTLCADYETAQKSALDLQDEATDELEASIRDIEAVNAKVRTNQDKARAEAEAKECGDQYTGLTVQLEAVRQQKTDLLQGAKLPLPGLSVEDGELTYKGKPWDCMSGSDQLKVSTAIVRALKPDCGFVLLDKLEQMDLDTLREFSAWMEAEGLQGIATRVSTGGECSIIIEDGYAKDPAAPVPTSWKAGEF
ncbi:MAG: AAA family ATPase [Oscillospiraceae bacterium]|nr:AAA family ATPase [Oscillospiraceae bacterium]